MKTLILVTLVFSHSVYSKTKLASENASVKNAVNTVDKINRVVAEASRPSNGCTEEQVELPRAVKSPDSSVPVIVCRPDDTSLTAPSTEDYSQLIRDYNIEFVQPQATVTASRDWRLFVHELNKFPPELMREMASTGGKIRVMIGTGVSEDPQWEVEKQRAIAGARAYRNWYNDPRTAPSAKVGKTPPQSDAEAASGYENTVEGSRQWDTVSGAGGNFSNRDWMVPTRIVLNRMYFSANRESDGRITHGHMQGATNLFLHEHGHALDNIYGPNTISGSDEWKELLDDAQVKAYLPKIFSDYEGRAEEGFAEAFSYFHSCDASRRQMETHAPKLAEYFRTFNVEKLRRLRAAR